MNKNDNSAAEYVYTNSNNAPKVPIRIQIEFNKDLIIKSIIEKVPFKHLYDKLLSEKKINCSYCSFCKHLSELTYVDLKNEKDEKNKLETKTIKPFVPPEKKEKKFVNTNGLTTNIDDLA